MNHDIYPMKGGANTFPMGPVDGLSITYAVGKENKGFKNIRVHEHFLKRWISLSPKGKCDGTFDGFTGLSFQFKFIGERKLGFQKHNRKSPFYERSKTIILWGDLREYSGWGQLDSFSDLSSVNENWGFRKTRVNRPFSKGEKTFIPRMEVWNIPILISDRWPWQ